MKHLKTFEGVFEDIPENIIDIEAIQELTIQMCIDDDIQNIQVENANDMDVRGDQDHYVVEIDWLDDGDTGEVRINIQLNVIDGVGTSVVTVENQSTGQLETSNSGDLTFESAVELVEHLDELVGTGMYLSTQVQNGHGDNEYGGDDGYGANDDDDDDYSEQGSPAGW